MGLQQKKILFDHEYFTHYFLCRYIPRAVGSDRLSQSIVSFKTGQSPHLKAWTDCAVAEIRKVKELEGSLVIRALSHDEQFVESAASRSLDRLGVKIAHTVHGSYRPDCLQKLRVIQKLTSLNKSEREVELNNAYRFLNPERTPKRVLILDDIYTSGATVRSIMSAVLKALPSATIGIFTLAITDYDRAMNMDVTLKSPPYRWEPQAGWMAIGEDSVHYAETLAKLKERILLDSFH